MTDDFDVDSWVLGIDRAEPSVLAPVVRRVLSEHQLGTLDDDTEAGVMEYLCAAKNRLSTDAVSREHRRDQEERQERIKLLGQLTQSYANRPALISQLLFEKRDEVLRALGRDDLVGITAPSDEHEESDAELLKQAFDEAVTWREKTSSHLVELIQMEQKLLREFGDPMSRPNSRPVDSKNEMAGYLFDIFSSCGLSAWRSCEVIAVLYNATEIDDRAVDKIQRSLYDKLSRK